MMKLGDKPKQTLSDIITYRNIITGIFKLPFTVTHTFNTTIYLEGIPVLTLEYRMTPGDDKVDPNNCQGYRFVYYMNKIAEALIEIRYSGIPIIIFENTTVLKYGDGYLHIKHDCARLAEYVKELNFDKDANNNF